MVGLADLSALDQTEIDFLNLLNGGATGTITLAGGTRLDASSAFQNYFNSTLTDRVATPMTVLRGSLDALRQAIIQEGIDADNRAREAGIQSAQSLLSASVGNLSKSQASSAAQAAALVQQIEALEAATNTNIRDTRSGSDSPFRVNVDGSLSFFGNDLQNTGGRTQAQVSQFQAGFEAPGGLRSQIDPFNATVRSANAAAAADIEAQRNAIRAMGAIPAFRRGGDHKGGLARVGEDDVEFVAPSKIIPGPKVRDLLSNEKMLMELRKLTAEVAAMREEQAELGIKGNRYAKKSAEMAEKADVLGIATRAA